MSEIGEGPSGIDQTSLRFYKPQVAEISARIPDTGLPQAIREQLELSGIHLMPEYSPHTLSSLLNDPILLVGTHSHPANDIMGILGAVPSERDDVYAVAHSMYMGLDSTISNHLIPLYGLDNQATKNLRERLRRRFLAGNYSGRDMSKREYGELNLESIRKAASKIDEGGIVLIFPEGPGEKDAEWFNGVGDIARKVSNPDAKVVFVKTQGDEWRNRARIRSAKSRRILGPTILRVGFSEPHPVAEYVDQSKTKQLITGALRSDYDAFSLGGRV